MAYNNKKLKLKLNIMTMELCIISAYNYLIF